jgi:hypothetical protein
VGALETLIQHACPLLGADKYCPAGGLALVTHVGDALPVLLGPAAATADAATRGELMGALLTAVYQQHSDLVAGTASKLPANLSTIQRVPWQVLESDGARRAFQELREAQALSVSVLGQEVRVPVSAKLACLPAGHSELLISGLPYGACRQGAAEACLRSAGYTITEATVVHERAGLQHRGPIPCMDRVVAVVRAPQDPTLLRLPRVVRWGEATLTLQVSRGVWRPPPAVVQPAAPAPRHPGPPTHAQVLSTVGTRNGVTAAVLATGAPPIAAEALQRALPPGCRIGLGYASGHAQAGPPAAAAPRDAAASLPPPELRMPDAPPPRALPSDEPLCGAALQFLEDGGDLSREEMEAVVLAARQSSPALWHSSNAAARPSELSCELRLALWAQACTQVGDARAAAFQPAEHCPRTAADCLGAELRGAVQSAGLEEVGNPAMLPEGVERAAAPSNRPPARLPPAPRGRSQLRSATPRRRRSCSAPGAAAGPPAPPQVTSPYPQRARQPPQTFWKASTPPAASPAQAPLRPPGKGGGAGL